MTDTNSIVAYDTTLRDGTQREGLSLSCEDKMRIAKRLDAFGMHYIEAGWPGSNPKDAAFFERAQDVPWKRAIITAFGATRRADLAPEDDPNLAALLAAKTKACTLFGKTWALHVTDVLRISLDTNLQMIEDSVAFLRAAGVEVIYDAEHFFDGYAADPAYALDTLHAAVRGGASTVVLCDTNGGTMPSTVGEVTRLVRSQVPCALGIHAHNDSECAVANAMAAVEHGATQVQGTINGYGERCGNANLISIIANLELKQGKSVLPPGHLSQLCELSRYVAEVANLPFDEHAAYVGKSAFAHKGGVHVAAMRRCETSYQHIEPERVGNVARVVVSELSGRGNIMSKAEELGLALPEGLESEVLAQIKAGEAEGFSYEAAEASIVVLARHLSPTYRRPFEVLDYQTTVGKRMGIETFTEASIRVRLPDDIAHTVDAGNGPVDALAKALRKALIPSYPDVERITLTGYKVRILDARAGASARIRVLIDMHRPSEEGGESWSTVGASSNVIEASLQALCDGIEYALGSDR